jgi:hypothetical protein
MLQFMAILGLSTFLSVIAYKMQHEGVQESQSIFMSPDIGIIDVSKLNPIE